MKFNNAVKTLSLLACASSAGAKKRKVIRAPDLPGVKNSGRKQVILAQAVDYPPYATLDPTTLEIAGFGPDVARGLEEVCDIDVVLVETQWDKCWVDGKIGIGDGLLNGHYHGCSTYTHTAGVRNRYLDFSLPILSGKSKPAGLLTVLDRMDEAFDPLVDGESTLDGIKVGDVVGWAPTADTLAITKNLCNGKTFSGYEFVQPPAPKEGEVQNANDVALKQLLDGDVDALWISADQAKIYKDACDDAAAPKPAWDCDMWQGFGSTFAYVQTGIFSHMVAGTTLAISKKGSGLARTLNPCIRAFLRTESYAELCVKYGLEESCLENRHLDDQTIPEMATPAPYFIPTNELTTSCRDGYCPCPNMVE